MQRQLLGILASFAFAAPVWAEKPLILVELFTSQGCYSCPPADEILKELSESGDILPLSLHVDYWDYLGWKDAFAIHKFGERQRSYNAKLRGRSLRVTPQMVFNGVAEVAGGSPASKTRILDIVDTLRQANETVQISLTNKDGMVTATLSNAPKDSKISEVTVVKYRPSSIVEIERGENAGKTLEYLNVVESLEHVGMWNGKDGARVQFDLPDYGHYAIFVQDRRAGPVMGARRLDWMPKS